MFIMCYMSWRDIIRGFKDIIPVLATPHRDGPVLNISGCSPQIVFGGSPVQEQRIPVIFLKRADVLRIRLRFFYEREPAIALFPLKRRPVV